MPKNLKIVASNTIEDTYANLNNMQTPPPKHVRCYATDNGVLKVGDGTRKFNELPLHVDGWTNVDTSSVVLKTISGDPIDQNHIVRVEITITTKGVNYVPGTPIMLATGNELSETRYYFVVKEQSGNTIKCAGEYINPSTSTSDMKVRIGTSEMLVQFDIILPNDIEADAPITDFVDGLIKNNAKTSFCYRLGKARILEVQGHLERAASTTQPKFNVIIGKESTIKVFPDFEVQETIDATDEPTYIYPNASNVNVIEQDSELEVIMPTLGTGDSPAAGLTLSFLAIQER